MKPGPKATPTDELTSWRAELQSRKAAVKAEVLAECPKAPAYLQPRARYYWGKVAPALHALGVLAATDLAAVGVLCQRLVDVERFGYLIDGKELVATETGVKANPLIRSRDMAIADARRLFADLGMTPTARVGLPKSDRPAGKVLNATGHFAKG